MVLDGKDPLPVLTKGAPSPHKSFFFTYGRHAALRMGNWKIVREKSEQAWKLYDLARDEAESKNLAAERPADVARLNTEYQAWLAAVKRKVKKTGDGLRSRGPRMTTER